MSRHADAATARFRRVAAWCLLPVVALVLAACGDDGDDTIPASGERETTTTEATTTTTSAPAGPEALAGDWTILSLTADGESTDAPDGATLSFADGTVVLATGCNRGNAPAEVGDGTLTIGPAGLTRMACADDVMAWEDQLVAFLEGELTYELDGETLVLAREGSELTLAPAADDPTTDTTEATDAEGTETTEADAGGTGTTEVSD